MKNSPDPSVHRQRERLMVQHVERLLEDERLRIDTTRGRRSVIGFIRDVSRSDRGVELKRLMSEMDKPDRELENQMPRGEVLDVAVAQRYLWLFKKVVGQLRVVCVSPTRALLAGETPRPLNTAEVTKLVSEIPPPLNDVPQTLVLVSTVGFTLEAHEKAERSANRTVVLAEPNDAGGWSVYGPPETTALTELFNPEDEAQKRQRVRQYIEESSVDMGGSGIATDKVAARTQLPVGLVEHELKAYASENPGLAAKRLDGRVVLFRERVAPSAPALGGSDMPLIDRLRGLFGGKGDNDKKIAMLSERRTLLSQQRDRAYEEMGSLEQREGALKEQFKEAPSMLTKRRITSQMLQLRKDLERRQQLLGVLNQQIEVISTDLYNMELVQQGKSAALPNTDELAEHAAEAEAVLADLQANGELAASIGGITTGGMSAEEQALFEELERETGTAAPEPAAEAPARERPAPERRVSAEPARPQPPTPQAEKRRGEAEPG